MKLKENIIKGVITDILGAIVILASVASVFVMGYDWTAAGIGIAVGGGFIGLGKK